MGLQRKVLLCILTFLKIGCWHYVQKILQVIIQNIYGFAEKGPSLHLDIFEKGSVTPFIKRFYKLSSRIFMGLQRKVLLCILTFLKIGCWHYVQKILQIIIQYIYGFLFMGLQRKGFMILNTMQLYIYLIIRTRNPDYRTFGPRASVLVLRGPPTYMEGLGIQKWVGY
jgi:uncharacterized linocin/CFP29 family protein